MKKIVVENLKYRYPSTEKLALDDISFTINQGEFIGIIGQNSAGKSTLCQALVGLVPHFYQGAYGGKVIVDGIEVKQSSISELSLKVGIVFQNPFTQVTGSKLTVYEEIAFGLENMGLTRIEMLERIDSVLDLFDITAVKNRNPFDLSGGQMQRMAIASIVAMKPDVIVLDEPTSQLDPQGSEEVFRAIGELSNQGMTVVMVEHKIEKIAEYSDRVLLLHEGKCVDFASPADIFSRDDLHEYGVVAPVYTRVCQALKQKNIDKKTYPATLSEAVEVLRGKIHD
ncbi:energy-coupling factor ABC transporter ATP-binding protein [Shimazuella sp. AN120528]|uniref:energy-coupling factor ABC transporter ATP-binding protein n=1 Tax=Shimazuella soli TaxID=1892854 RepID=UPI001F0FED4D|nr:ABC transporter ATP-binding protein [Shimazuella soli]MCH5586077.1 energy-coupling factor ABC transporter ATP-binding protein [Shimazuella soli]